MEEEEKRIRERERERGREDGVDVLEYALSQV